MCGSASSANSSSRKAASAVTGLNVGFMTSTPVNSGAWDPVQYAAFQAAAKRYQWHTKVVQTVPVSQAQQTLTGMAESGDQLIIATSDVYEAPVRAVAPKFPNVKFAILDDAANQKTLPNEAVFQVDWFQFGYIGGALAALASTNGKIGLITGEPILASLKAFGGAKAGAREIKKKAKVLADFTNDFVDPSKGALAAAGLISRGATATFMIGGAMDPAILQTDAQHHAKGIGTYKNERSMAPGAVASNVLLHWQHSYVAMAHMINAGKWGGVQNLTIKNGGIGVMPLRYVAHAKKKNHKLEHLLRLIKRGKVQIPRKLWPHH